MAGYGKQEAAERADVSVEFLDRIVALGIIGPADDGTFGTGDIRRVSLVRALDESGIPLDGLAEALKQGKLSLDFLDRPEYDRFVGLSDVTFAQLAERTQVPLDLLMVMREATGASPPAPNDRVREDELRIAPFLGAQIAYGFRPEPIERLLRVTGESMRRIAEQEADWWRTEVIERAMAGGFTPEKMLEASGQAADTLTTMADDAMRAIYRAQQQRAWTSNIIAGFEVALEQAGLHSKLERPPAMCFLDITGYTRLTQERGDEAAAGLAQQLNRLVQRTSVAHAGKPVKWLGDGVMLYFREPGPGVVAALDMVDGVRAAGLPPAHVGLHAGPILFQEGDYFGTTVNVASRIAEYARPGEVLVSQDVVDAADGSSPALRFTEIGPIELKGVAGAMRLHAAHRA